MFMLCHESALCCDGTTLRFTIAEYKLGIPFLEMCFVEIIGFQPGELMYCDFLQNFAQKQRRTTGGT